MSGDDTSMIESLIPTFLDELSEHLTELNRGLLTLEKNITEDEREQVYANLLRIAHTLKGASGMMSMSVVEDACHRFEDIVDGLCHGAVVLAPALLDLLFEMADGIEEVGVRLGEQRELDDTPLHALLPRLSAALRATPDSADDDAAERRTARKAAPSSDVPSSSNGSNTPEASNERASAAADNEQALAQRASVRIGADKLDSLVSRAGELIVANDRLQARAHDLGEVRAFVGRWRSDWHHLQRALGRTRAGSEITPRRSGSASGSTADIETLEQAVLTVHSKLGQLGRDLDCLAGQLNADSSSFRQSVVPIEEEIRSFRMLPFSYACQGLERAVRDVARISGKQVALTIEGEDVELDRSILEALKDPLLHLVRNAVDHGVEKPHERKAAGKDPTARLVVSAALRGARVEISVSDDGSGLDYDAIRAKAESKDLAIPKDDRELANLIFAPGFSTAAIVTQISGRGVGLDVVKAAIESLHGNISLSPRDGEGTRFSLTVPLTLTTAHVLLVRAAGQIFAPLAPNVVQLIVVEPSEVRSVGGRPVLFHADQPIAIASLAGTLGIGNDDGVDLRGPAPAMIITAGDQTVAFAVDELISERQVVVKSLGRRLQRVRNVSGATILPGGEIALILNTGELVRSALARGESFIAEAKADNAQLRKRILLADDMPTTRVLERSILETAGYEVIVAADGAEAWDKLQTESVDLVVSDVDMPVKDGFSLTESIRGCERLHDLPVILVTARDTEADKTRGIEVGANGYIIKSSFSQGGLLQTIAQLL